MQSGHTNAVYLMDARGGLITAREVRIQPTCTWTSPRSNVTYPVCHRIQADRLELLVTPLALDSEVFYEQQPAVYEGHAQVVGVIHGVRVTGTGTTELRGFR